MPTLKPADFLILAVLLAVAGFPVVVKLARTAWAKYHGAAAVAGESGGSGWRNQWVQTLMDLQTQLESRSDQQASLKLCRQLIWELLGGGQK